LEQWHHAGKADCHIDYVSLFRLFCKFESIHLITCVPEQLCLLNKKAMLPATLRKTRGVEQNSRSQENARAMARAFCS
jgi:hypothetical protein